MWVKGRDSAIGTEAGYGLWGLGFEKFKQQLLLYPDPKWITNLQEQQTRGQVSYTS
jgi:hypothetical protein